MEKKDKKDKEDKRDKKNNDRRNAFPSSYNFFSVLLLSFVLPLVLYS